MTFLAGEPGGAAPAAGSLPTRLVTSPLFFAHERRDGELCALGLATRERLRAVSPRAWELLYFFLQPHTRAESRTAGFTEAEVVEAHGAGLLVDADAPAGTNMFRWESNRWSRAAYLLYSQQDLPYVEPVDKGHHLSALSAFRRGEIADFQKEAPYPPRFWVDPVWVHRLPVPEAPITYSLDSMLGRRSVRRFSETPVAAGTLGALLYHATANVRIAEDSKTGGDPYYLLNSFYAWLHVYLVVQGVEGVRRGVYQYDFDKNVLLAVDKQPSDEDLASTIQGQNWIGGGGASVFIIVQWDRYQWLYRHSRAYLNLLIQIGEFAQELLQVGYQLGLVGWMTPAVAESRAAAMLGLDAVDSDVDAMCYLKLGYPR